MRHSLLWMLLVLLAACSSLKPPVQPQAKQDADALLRYALLLEASNDLEGAADSFESARIAYRSFGEAKGQLASLSGLARLELLKGNQPEFLHKLNNMKLFIDTTAPDLGYYILLLQMESKQMEKDYAEVAKLASKANNVPLEEQLQFSIAKLQAESYLQTATLQQVQDLIKLSKQQHKQLKKGKSNSTELMSSAWYSLGYYYFLQKDFKNASLYLDKAESWDYQYGNFRGLAHNLWLKAQIAKAVGDKMTASSLYERAEGIFASISDSAAVQSIKQEKQPKQGDKQ